MTNSIAILKKDCKLSFESARNKAYFLIEETPLTEEFNAQKILSNFPELYNYKSIVLDLIYEEYCREIEQKNSIDETNFAHRFPDYEKSILNQIAIHKLLDDEESSSPQEIQGDRLPQVGDTFLDFHLVSELGQGAFSKVFLGHEKYLAAGMLL